MNSGYFFAQDQAGNMQKVHIVRPAAANDDAASQSGAAYALDDGSALKRIDSDTFQIVDTGAFVTLVRE